MCSERWLRLARIVTMIAAGLSVSDAVAEAQLAKLGTGRIIKETPLRLLPDVRRGPLLIMEAGVLVEVNGREGTWVQVTVDGSQFGRRTGYVESQFIEIFDAKAAGTAPRVTAADVIAPSTTPTLAAPSSPVAVSTRSTRAIATTETFQKSKLNVTVEDKTRELDVIVRYQPDALVIVDRKSGGATKTFPYSAVKGAEYSYAKSPRWKTAIFVSPLFLFTSGKKHWFLVQGEGDYALLHLDKSNYRLILAAFEARSGLKVETVADTK